MNTISQIDNEIEAVARDVGLKLDQIASNFYKINCHRCPLITISFRQSDEKFEVREKFRRWRTIGRWKTIQRAINAMVNACLFDERCDALIRRCCVMCRNQILFDGIHTGYSRCSLLHPEIRFDGTTKLTTREKISHSDVSADFAN